MRRKKMPIPQLLAAVATGGLLLVPVSVAAVYFQTEAPQACTVTTKYSSSFHSAGTAQYTLICPPGTKPVISTIKGLDDGNRFPNNRPDVCRYC